MATVALWPVAEEFAMPHTMSGGRLVGPAIGVERPEALAFIVREFFERRDLFLVSRENGLVFP